MAKLVRWLQWQKPVPFIQQPSVAQPALPLSWALQKAHISSWRGLTDFYRQRGSEGVSSVPGVRACCKQRPLLLATSIICLLCTQNMEDRGHQLCPELKQVTGSNG